MILTSARSTEVAERIRVTVDAALEARKISARRASIDVFGHDGLIRDIRAGRLPSVDRIEALFDYLGLEAYFGPRRSSLSLPDVASNHAPAELAPLGFITIPWAEFGRPGSAPIAFSRSWLAEHGLIADFLVATLPDEIRIDGLLADDAVALLDKQPGDRTGHALWCYRSRGRVVVAHMTFAGDITVIHPARAELEPEILEGPITRSLEIFGKVAWLGQSIPFRGKVG